jgi:hypothetical protein
MFERGRFIYGKCDYEQAQGAAEACSVFKIDDEDECVDTEIRSCYNCRYRRWTEVSFQCMKKNDRIE